MKAFTINFQARPRCSFLHALPRGRFKARHPRCRMLGLKLGAPKYANGAVPFPELQDLEFVRQIGEGSFGKVYAAK